MIVLTDLEWVENKARHIAPTQLAALRVNETWEPVSMFNALCRPRDASFHQWNHVAFAGASRESFLFAPSARTVFGRFVSWLKPDDILLWWGQDAPKHFAGLMKIMGFSKLQNKSHSVQAAFQFFVDDGRKTQGGLYQLAKVRQIPLLKPEHCSVNDARMMQKLLQKVNFQLEYLHRQIPAGEAREIVQAAKISAYQFQIDRSTNLLHKQGCALLPGGATVIGCRDLSSGMKYHAAPCPACCKHLWSEYLVARNKDVIKRSQCNYFYLPSGRAFHKPDCRIILHSSVPPSGTVYFKTCEKTGRTPCRICCPEPNSDPTPEQLQAEERILIPLQTLTNVEMQAIKRHRQASRERAKLDLSNMTEQQRTDSITLTATRFAFWAAPGYQTFHTRNCIKLNGMKNIRGFARYGDAVHAGFSPCRHCRPSAKQDAILSIPIYNQARAGEKIEDIISLCEAKGYACSLDKNELLIETQAGRWLVDIRKRPIFIEHQHTDGSIKGKSKIHWQPRMFLSLQDVVAYITKHDAKLVSKNNDPEEN